MILRVCKVLLLQEEYDSKGGFDKQLLTNLLWIRAKQTTKTIILFEDAYAYDNY